MKVEDLDLDAVLCYVSGYAYFTTCPLREQCGDDWNDAPYEHNAGTPYEWQEYMKTKPYKIYALGFRAGYDTPEQLSCGGNSSRYCVDEINNRHIPWLTPCRYAGNDKTEPIFGGETMREFIRKIQESGGTVFVPLEKIVSTPAQARQEDR